VLGLRGEVDRHQRGIGLRACDHEHVGRPGEPVDPDVAADQALGLLHVEVARAGDDVGARDALGAVGERGDRVGAAHRVDGVGPAQRARREDQGMGARRADDDLVDARGAGGDHAHDDRRGIWRAAAGDVDRRAAHRDLAQGHRVLLGENDPALVVDPGLGHRADVGDRHLQPGAHVGGQRVGADRLGAQRPGGAVEALDVAQQRFVAVLAHVGDDRRDRLGHRGCARRQRAHPRGRFGRVAQREALNRHAGLSRPRRSPRP
jgi:hypothetical protein